MRNERYLVVQGLQFFSVFITPVDMEVDTSLKSAQYGHIICILKLEYQNTVHLLLVHVFIMFAVIFLIMGINIAANLWSIPFYVRPLPCTYTLWIILEHVNLAVKNSVKAESRKNKSPLNISTHVSIF